MPDSVDFLSKRVLVLGASGYIGSAVVAALSGNPAYRAIAASRRSQPAVDATDPQALRSAMRDVDSVVNCIAGNDRAMVQATQAVCDAARDSAPRRIIHISSMAVYGAATGTVREEHPPVAPVSGYGQAKIACEQIIAKYVRDGGDAVVLRPTCVFGPGSPQWTTRLVRLLRAGRIGDMGPAGDGRANLAFIDDVAAAIVATLHSSDVSGRIFNVSSSSEMTWNQFLATYARLLRAVPVRRIPARQLKVETKLLAPAFRIAAKLLGSSAPEAITPSLLGLWRQDIRIDCSAAEQVLGLSGTTPARMIEATLRHDNPTQERVLS